MKKLAVPLLVLVALALLVTPWLIGSTIESSLAQSLEANLPPETRNQLSITQTQFDKGWLTSRGQLEISYSVFGQEPLQFQLDLDIKHGPILLTKNGLRFGTAYADVEPIFDGQTLTQLLSDVSDTPPEIDLTLLTGFSQSLEMGLNVAPFAAMEAGATVQMGGITGLLSINGDQSGGFTLDIGELNFNAQNEGIQFEFAGLTADFTSAQFNDVFAPSATTLEMPSISSTAPLPFSIAGILVDSRITESSAGEGKADIYQRMRVEQVDADIPVQSLDWTFELNEIHPALMDGYRNIISDIQSQTATVDDLAALTSQFGDMSQELGLMMLNNSLVINNLIETNAYYGDHKADLKIRWGGIPAADDITRLDFKEIINALTISVQLDLDEKAALKTPASDFLQSFISQGMLNLENGRIKLDGSLQNSELTLNGESYPIDEFLPI